MVNINTVLDDFDQFWASYPRKVGKLAAVKVWTKLHPDLSQVLTALAWQAKTRQWQDLTYVPHPTTWLRQGRYLDEPPFVTDLRDSPCPRCGSPEGLCADIKVCNRRWLDSQKKSSLVAAEPV